MRKNKILILFLFLVTSAFAQNVYDGKHLLQFADYLYNNKEYQPAINEYKHALFLGSCGTPCQKKLFNSFLVTKQYLAGINTFKSIYPQGIACNDTLEMVYGKMLLLNANYDDADKLVQTSNVLSPDQRFFISISNDLLAENWENAKQKSLLHSGNPQPDPYQQIIFEIENLNYKKPFVSLMLSAVIPGSGKMYAGYWYDGIISLAMVGITAWQAYRGFTLYGANRPYSWIFATLSASFYISNLYGSFKAANTKNYSLRQNIHHDIEEVFHSVYTY